MSAAKWCDMGGHAYSANDDGAQELRVTQQVNNQWGGAQPSTVVQDICGECASEAGLLGLGAKMKSLGKHAATKQIENRNTTPAFSPRERADIAKANKYDPEYVAWLEEQADEWEAEHNAS